MQCLIKIEREKETLQVLAGATCRENKKERVEKFLRDVRFSHMKVATRNKRKERKEEKQKKKNEMSGGFLW